MASFVMYVQWSVLVLAFLTALVPGSEGLQLPIYTNKLLMKINPEELQEVIQNCKQDGLHYTNKKFAPDVFEFEHLHYDPMSADKITRKDIQSACVEKVEYLQQNVITYITPVDRSEQPDNTTLNTPLDFGVDAKCIRSTQYIGSGGLIDSGSQTLSIETGSDLVLSVSFGGHSPITYGSYQWLLYGEELEDNVTYSHFSDSESCLIGLEKPNVSNTDAGVYELAVTIDGITLSKSFVVSVKDSPTGSLNRTGVSTTLLIVIVCINLVFVIPIAMCTVRCINRKCNALPVVKKRKNLKLEELFDESPHANQLNFVLLQSDD